MKHGNVVSNGKLIIAGFMGVGKSTVGQLLARRLGWTFIDLDEVLERQFGCSIPEIFEIWGEKAFRDKERETAISLCDPTDGGNSIIALGGGTFTHDPVRQFCMQHATVVLLDLSWEEWRKLRMPRIIDSRPVLKSLSLEATRELFERRRAQYSHHHRFLVDNLTPDEVVDQLIDRVGLSYGSAETKVNSTTT